MMLLLHSKPHLLVLLPGRPTCCLLQAIVAGSKKGCGMHFEDNIFSFLRGDVGLLAHSFLAFFLISTCRYQAQAGHRHRHM